MGTLSVMCAVNKPGTGPCLYTPARTTGNDSPLLVFCYLWYSQYTDITLLTRQMTIMCLELTICCPRFLAMLFT